MALPQLTKDYSLQRVLQHGGDSVDFDPMLTLFPEWFYTTPKPEFSYQRRQVPQNCILV